MNEPVGKIGKSIFIKGELTGNEDLTIEGTVEGKIEVRDHSLIVGATGKIKAEVLAKTVTIQGEVNGNVRAQDRIEISASGRVRGDLASPKIMISDGAVFKGSVDMEKVGGGAEAEARPRPAATAVPTDMRAAVTASTVEARPIKG